MSWQMTSGVGMSLAEYEMRLDDTLMRFITNPSLKLSAENFLVAMGLDYDTREIGAFERSDEWMIRIVPAVFSGRKNAPVALEEARQRGIEQTRQASLAAEYKAGWEKARRATLPAPAQPQRLDVLYGVGTIRLNANSAYDPPRARPQPVPLGGPRAYFDD